MKDGSSLTPTESKPVRMDLSNTIFKQLSKPLHSLSFDVKTPNCEADSVDCISLDISKQNEVSTSSLMRMLSKRLFNKHDSEFFI